MGGYTSDKQKPHSFSFECGLFVAEAPNISRGTFRWAHVSFPSRGFLSSCSLLMGLYSIDFFVLEHDNFLIWKDFCKLFGCICVHRNNDFWLKFFYNHLYILNCCMTTGMPIFPFAS